MRFLAALAFLLQLQPLVVSALCFHDAEVTQEECPMQHDAPAAGSVLAAPGTDLPTGCGTAEYCTRTASAVPKFAQHFHIVSVLHGAPAPLGPSMAPSSTPAPPFHPPRA